MSFDKTVKNACKPKKDVPKAKVRFVHPALHLPDYLPVSVVFWLINMLILILLLLSFLFCVIVLPSPSSFPSSYASDYLNITTLHTPHHTTPHSFMYGTKRGETQYLDPIIQATHTTDGAMIDICKSLGSCLREPKNIVSPGFCLFVPLSPYTRLFRSERDDSSPFYYNSIPLVKV